MLKTLDDEINRQRSERQHFCQCTSFLYTAHLIFVACSLDIYIYMRWPRFFISQHILAVDELYTDVHQIYNYTIYIYIYRYINKSKCFFTCLIYIIIIIILTKSSDSVIQYISIYAFHFNYCTHAQHCLRCCPYRYKQGKLVRDDEKLCRGAVKSKISWKARYTEL